jgi:hypothetical protein
MPAFRRWTCDSGRGSSTAEAPSRPLLCPYRAEEQREHERTGEDEDQHQPKVVVRRKDAHDDKHKAEAERTAPLVSNARVGSGAVDQRLFD